MCRCGFNAEVKGTFDAKAQGGRGAEMQGTFDAKARRREDSQRFLLLVGNRQGDREGASGVGMFCIGECAAVGFDNALTGIVVYKFEEIFIGWCDLLEFNPYFVIKGIRGNYSSVFIVCSTKCPSKNSIKDEIYLASIG